MRIFSKIVFICNVCFIISAILRVVELSMRHSGNNNAAIPLPAIEGTIVVLGFIAIFVNTFFLLYVLVNKLRQQQINFSKYLLWFNIALLPVEIWYFFFSSNIS
jgi:hypothetical protein